VQTSKQRGILRTEEGATFLAAGNTADVSKEDKYVQFPLCALALRDEDLLGRIISYGFVEAGVKAMCKLSDDEKRQLCRQFGLPASRHNSFELAVHLGAEICDIRPGTHSLQRHGELQRHIDAWTSRHGPEPLVRIRTDLCFRAHDGQGISIREFRVLAAIYSSIGANRYRAITELVIRMRAIGCKCAAVMKAEKGTLPPLLSEKEARGTVTRLHETGFFARVTPIRHGRKTFYSIRLTDSELRAQLLARLTYSKNFADERRKKDKELADQIRVQKGDYNSELEKGQREGDAEATEGRREGDYDKKPLNRKPFNRNPHNNAHQHPLAPGISDSESAFLNTYNRFARSHKALGFLEVDILTDEVEKALEIFEDYDPDDFLEVLEEEANDPEGGRTFVRCCWNNY
jgi:hypothetical protein